MSPSADEHPVRIARQARNLDLRQLADLTGCSPSLISMTEKGYVPKLKRRWQFANALQLPIDQLWPDEQNPPIEETT